MKEIKVTIDHFTGLREMLSFWMTNHSQKRIVSPSSHVMIYLLDDERILFRSKAKSIGTRLPRILYIKETFRISNTMKSLTILVSTVAHTPQLFSDKSKLLESSEIICKSIIPVDFTCLHVKSYQASLVSMGCISDEKIGSVQLTVMRSDYCNQHMDVEVVDLRGATPSAAECLHWDAVESFETKDCVQKSPVIHRNENISIERDEKEAKSSMFSATRAGNGIADHPKPERENVDSNEMLSPLILADEAKYEPSFDIDSKKHEESECMKRTVEDRADKTSFVSLRQEGKYNEDDTVSDTSDYKEIIHTGHQPFQKNCSFTSSQQPLLKQSEGKDDVDSVHSRLDPSRLDGNKSIAQKEKSQDIEKKYFSREMVEDSGAYSVPIFKGLRGTHHKPTRVTREMFLKDMSISSEDSISLPRFKRNSSINSHLSHGSSSSSSFYSFDGLRRTLSISNKRMGGARNSREILSPSLSSSPSSSVSISSYLLHGEEFKGYQDDNSMLSDTS